MSRSSQRSSLGSRHSDTSGKLSLGDFSDRKSLEMSVDPRRQMCQSIDSVDTDVLVSSVSQRSLQPSSTDKEDHRTVQGANGVYKSSSHGSHSAMVYGLPAQGATAHGAVVQDTMAYDATAQGTANGTHESNLLQDLSRDNKKYYSLAMVSTNSSLDVDDFVRRADRASTVASCRDVHSSREGLEDLRAEQAEAHLGYELYSPSTAMHAVPDSTVQNLPGNPSKAAKILRNKPSFA